MRALVGWNPTNRAKDATTTIVVECKTKMIYYPLHVYENDVATTCIVSMWIGYTSLDVAIVVKRLMMRVVVLLIMIIITGKVVEIDILVTK
jgi:hypothetical protein